MAAEYEAEAERIKIVAKAGLKRKASASRVKESQTNVVKSRAD